MISFQCIEFLNVCLIFFQVRIQFSSNNMNEAFPLKGWFELTVKMNNLTFCPPNVTFIDFWENHGMSRCFMDTLGSSISFSYIALFGSLQLRMYHRHATEIASNLLSKSKLYNFQKFLLYFVPVLCIFHIILQATILRDGQIYGYEVIKIIKITP